MMLLKSTFKITCILIILGTLNVFSQNKVFDGNPDTAFERARNLAFNQQRKQAQDSLLFILTAYPNYHDIREFLGTTYSWDGAYKIAREEFAYILKKDKKRKTTWIAAINNELWGDTPFSALKLANDALKYFPKNVDILYLKASAEENSNNPEEALLTIKNALEINPDNQKSKDYMTSLNSSLSHNVIGFKASVDLYSEVFDPMQLHALNYSRKTKYGSIIGRMNFSRRFQENGIQFEVDMYPKIAKGLYAYLNIGFANTFLFPDIRYGAELHQSLPKSFEISFGFRALKYTSTTTIYTGSIGWYSGNSYLSFRTYITPGDSGSSKSGTLNYRKYRSDANNYFSVSAGMGFSPEIYRFNFGGNENEIINLKSQKVRAGYYFTSSNKKNAYGFQFGVTHQEISFDPGNYFWIYSLSTSWNLKFK